MDPLVPRDHNLPHHHCTSALHGFCLVVTPTSQPFLASNIRYVRSIATAEADLGPALHACAELLTAELGPDGGTVRVQIIEHARDASSICSAGEVTEWIHPRSNCTGTVPCHASAAMLLD